MIEKIVPEYDVALSNLEYFFRKGAHFFSYLVLGVLVMNALRRSGVEGFRLCIFALGICVLYAISDEVHQLFVHGRSGQVTDVLLDSVGAVVGIGGLRLLMEGWRK
jgi:VanZ family protein